RLMLLRLLALRPDDQEVHDDENEDEGQELDQHIGPAGRGAAGLGKGRGYGHRMLLRWRPGPGENGADYNGAATLCKRYRHCSPTWRAQSQRANRLAAEIPCGDTVLSENELRLIAERLQRLADLFERAVPPPPA